MNITNGIKLYGGSISAKGIMAVRKVTGLPMGEIRSRAATGDYLFECDGTDSAGIATCIALYCALRAAGDKPQVYEAGEPMEFQLLLNKLQQHRDIAEQLGMADDYEGEAWWNLDLSQFQEY